MNLLAAIKLIVAMARALEVPPSLLAELFGDNQGCQDYLDEVVRLHQEGKAPTMNA